MCSFENVFSQARSGAKKLAGAVDTLSLRQARNTGQKASKQVLAMQMQ